MNMSFGGVPYLMHYLPYWFFPSLMKNILEVSSVIMSGESNPDLYSQTSHSFDSRLVSWHSDPLPDKEWSGSAYDLGREMCHWLKDQGKVIIQGNLGSRQGFYIHIDIRVDSLMWNCIGAF